jgi:hypothetical protein
MDAVSRQSRSAVVRRSALALLCALTFGAAGEGVLADPGQARGTGTGGLPSSQQQAGAAGAVALAAAASSRPGGLSRATGAPLASAVLDEHQPASATLEKCVVAVGQDERYATFAGKMTALPGTTGMAIRIDVEKREPGQAAFHLLEGSVPGLGAWRSAEPGVKIFKDLKQVIDLEAPAAYRAAIHFRWLEAKGPNDTDEVVVRHEVLRTPPCRQPPPERSLGGEA